jgi:hypothetical protein
LRVTGSFPTASRINTVLIPCSTRLWPCVLICGDRTRSCGLGTPVVFGSSPALLGSNSIDIDLLSTGRRKTCQNPLHPTSNLFWSLIGAILATFFAIVCSAIDWLQQVETKDFSKSRSDPTFVNRCRTTDTSDRGDPAALSDPRFESCCYSKRHPLKAPNLQWTTVQ